MSRSGSGSWKPPKELVALRDRLSELFEEAGGPRAEKNDATEAAMGWIPALDVWADEHAVVARLEVPGLDPTDIHIILDHDALAIRGERSRQQTGTFHRLERPMGPFERLVKLPSPIDLERSEARLELGVLTVVMPRTQASPRGSRTLAIR